MKGGARKSSLCIQVLGILTKEVRGSGSLGDLGRLTTTMRYYAVTIRSSRFQHKTLLASTRGPRWHIDAQRERAKYTREAQRLMGGAEPVTLMEELAWSSKFDVG